ncbi:MAG: hypothetical protein ABJA78_14650 [Ferruginibacter sp.]
MKRICLLAVLFCLSLNFAFAGNNTDKPLAAMSGIYTVNPVGGVTATNFLRIGQADTALMTNGISGPVTIQIYNGTYSQTNVGLGTVAGSSAANPITFTSFSNDSVQVVINSTLNFNGASFVTIKKLNLSLVVVDGNVSDYTFSNNQILGLSWLGGDNITFTNNYIKPQVAFTSLTNPGPAISFTPKSATSLNNIVIEGNIFRQVMYLNQAGVGTTGVPSIISFTKVHRPIIRNNFFRNINMSCVGYGLIGCCTYVPFGYGSTFQFDRCTDTAFVEKNRFDSVSTDRLVHDIDATNGNSTTPRMDLIVIRNNFFTVTGQLGMIPYAQATASIQFYYNNINNIGNGSGTDLENNISVMKNNIFSSSNGKKVLNFATHPGNSDYNNFYSSGPVLVSYSGTPNANYATLAQYQTATSTNANSKNVNPKYYDSVNLHVKHPSLLATGTPYPAANPLLKDIDDDNRNATNPCIGADEFMPPSNDVIALQYTSPKINFTAAAALPLKLKFINNGSANLGQVNIRWAVNGVEQTPYAWSGNLAYDSTTEVTFGNYTFDMVKYTALKIWTDLPNASPDMVPVNDTIRVDSIMPYARGTLTLGGSSPQITSFTKANELLNYGGIDGAVNIAVRAGKYTEQPIIKFTRGTSATNTITFAGENNNANLDTLSFSSLNSGLTPFFTMRLDSAAYYSFKNITFQSLSQYSREVEFSRKTRFVTFDSCVFTAASTSAANAHVEGNTINSLAQLDSNIVFTNNRFYGSYSGIQLPLRNGIIRGNRFENMINGNASFGVIHLTGSFAPLNNTLVIDSNYVANYIACTLSFGGTCFQYGYQAIPGINISSTSSGNKFEIAGNNLNVISRNGIQISSSGTAANPIRVFNNFITQRSGSNAILSTGDYAEIINNSFADSANSGSNLVELRGNNTVFKNNILVKGLPGNTSSSTSNLLYLLTSALSTLTSSNNAYYITDTSKAIFNGTASIGLVQWKATGKDANSNYTTPAFLNIASDLHIDKNRAGAVDVAKKAVPVSYISFDIDDSTRSLTTPCIGADEFTLNAVDAGVSAITSPGFPMPVGNNNVIVSIRNYGSTNITSALVNWSVNGILQTAFNYSGSLITGDSATNIVLGNFNFNSPQAYTIKAWTENVNGGGDLNPLNDTITKIVYPALCGTYTIGGASPDFITPKAAFNYAALAGVGCATILNIRDGQYNETDSIRNVPGTSAINTLTIQSESLDSSKVAIFQTDYPPASANPVLLIDNAKYIKLKNISIKRTPAAGTSHFYFAMIALANDVTGLSISNSEISSTGAVQLINFPLQTSNIPSNLSFTNNNFIGGAAITLTGYINLPMNNVVISNNNFRTPIPGSNYNQVNLTYMGNITINNNYFDSAANGAVPLQAINIQAATGKISITNNKIMKRKATYGIYLSQVTGLNTYDSAAVIANNFIEMDSVGNFSALHCINTGRNVKILYNNLLNNCSTASSNSSYALYFTNSFAAGTLKDTIADNNIIVSGTGFGLYQQQGAPGDENCTNNNIWSATSTKLATYNSTNYTTIAALATASNTHTATVSMNPVYVNNNDLHITELNLRNLGKPFPYVLTDIDNDTRGTTTSTIGADEIVVNNLDAGITAVVAPVKPFAAGNQNVSVTIRNYGSTNLISAFVNWSVNGTLQTPFSYSGNIAFNTSANAVIGTVNFVVDSAFSIKAWTSSPNGGSDANTNNDTVLVNNIYPALNGTYTLGGGSPDFKSFTRSSNNLKYGGMLGTVIFNARDGRYNESLFVDSIPFQNNYSVTWQSESGDSTKVLLAGTSFTGDNLFGTVQLNNVKNISFRKMSFQVKMGTISSTYSSLIYLSKKTKNIQFVSNQFIDSTNNNGQGGYASGARFFYNRDDFASNSSNNYHSIDSSILIDRNYFKQVNQSTNTVIDLGGTTHAIFQGSVTDYYLNALTISNNRYDMQLFSKPGINITEADSVLISGNKLSGNISFYGRDYMVMDKNTVYHEGFSQNAVTLAGAANRAAGKTAIVSNNTIQTVRVGTFNGVPVGNVGLFINALDRVNIIHNTIVTSDTGNVTGYNYAAALYMVTSKFDTVKNNIFYNTNGGNLLYQQSVTNYISNNNDYVYSNHFSTTANNLAAQKTLYGQDAQSVENIQPYFRGPKDLHASNILLKAAAAVSPSTNIYLSDLDGQSRGATVCYGADEFTQPLNDMVVLDASPKKIFPTGLNTFSIHVYNNGVNPITTFNTTASITNYPDNSTPTVIAGTTSATFNGNIAPGAEATISIGQMNVPLFRNILKVNTSNLNNVGDEVNFDDSLQIDNYYAGLNGAYTFKDAYSGSSATFKYFADVAAQLKFGGVYGPSSLSMLPGISTSNPFYVDSIPNRAALSPLTIQSQNGDSSSTGFSTFFQNDMVIYKANNVSIKNLYFGVPNSDATYNGLTLGYNSQNITVQNCRFKRPLLTGNLTTPANVNLVIGNNYSGQTGYSDSNYVVKNNSFEGGYAGIYLFGPTAGTPGNIFTGNNFLNQGSYGMDLMVMKNALVDSNTIVTNTSDAAYIALQSESNIGKTRITRNRIFVQTDGTGIKALETYLPPYALTDTLLIANNFITAGATQASINMNLNIGHKKQTSVYHNSLLNRSTNSSAISLKTQSIANGGGRFEVLNNIMFHKTAGIALSVSKDANVTYVQHNEDLFTPGTILAQVNGTNYANLAALSATGIEYSSVSGDPLYISDNDLHVDGSMVNNTGSYDSYTQVSTDIDNEPRSNSNPDIGADEFRLPDFGIVQLESPLSSCSHTASETVKAWVKNFSTAPRTNVPVAYRINNGSIVRDTVRVMVNAGDSVLFSFTQTADLSIPTDYYFDLWTAYRGDSLPTNDTLKHILVATTPANNILPYYTGFEGTNAGWYTGGQNSSFKWGVIFSGIIDSSANGLNAWKSNLTGPHNNNEKSYLYSPCFDLTSLTEDPTLNFNLAFQLENNNDKAWVEYSADAGSTWIKLGAQGEGLAWYNDAGGYWTGDNHYWHNAKHLLPVMSLGDRSHFRLRFVLQSNSSIVQDGLAIDDISIYTGVNAPVSMGTYTNRTATSTGSANFIPVNDPSGNRILEVNDNGNNLGTISVDVNQNAGNAPTWYNGSSYLGRSFVIHVQNQPVTPVRVRLFISQAEFDAWKAADPTIDQVQSIAVYKFSGTVEDFDLSNNTSGTLLTIAPAQITKIPYLDGYFLEFTVSSFSEFWITKGNPPVSCLSNGISFTAATTGATYQWQVSNGAGYSNISNGGYYAGANAATLQINGIPTSATGTIYRCVVNGVNGPDNTLRFTLTWTGAVNNDWANPGNWSCSTTADENTDVVIPAAVPNYPRISTSTSVRKITAQPGSTVTVGAGVNLEVKGR